MALLTASQDAFDKKELYLYGEEMESMSYATFPLRPSTSQPKTSMAELLISNRKKEITNSFCFTISCAEVWPAAPLLVLYTLSTLPEPEWLLILENPKLTGNTLDSGIVCAKFTKATE